jgi:hypothetical protein
VSPTASRMESLISTLVPEAVFSMRE